VAPSVQRRKVWLTPTTRVACRNAAQTRNPLKFAGCPKLRNRSQPLENRSSPYCEGMWRRYCCLTSFFRLSIHALVAKIQPHKIVRWCRDGDFCVLYFQRAACSTFQTCILNLRQCHTMCPSMVDIQSAAAEIRRGKKERKIERHHRAKI